MKIKDGGNKMKYLVVIEETQTGYSAFSPDLPGCIATGTTREDAEKNMKEAISFHVKGMTQEGLKVPKPHTTSYPAYRSTLPSSEPD